jgi:hypothetical protein
MDIATTPAIERIARVLAGEHLSSNADGEQRHAGPEVDAIWRDFVEQAIAVLKTLREPDEAMERAGDVAMWQRMIEAALDGAGDHHGEGEPIEPEPAALHDGP